MRWRALQTGRVYVKQHPGDAQLSLGVLDELRDMVGKEGETFSNRLSTVSESTKTFLTVICCSQKLACTLSISHSLCSAVHNCDSLCRRSSRSPIMLSILLVSFLLFVYLLLLHKKTHKPTDRLFAAHARTRVNNVSELF